MSTVRVGEWVRLWNEWVRSLPPEPCGYDDDEYDQADYGMGDPHHAKELCAVKLKSIHDNAMALSSRIHDLDALGATMAEAIAEDARYLMGEL